MKLHSILKIVVSVTLFLVLAGCSDNRIKEPQTVTSDGEAFVINGSISIQEMPLTVSRSVHASGMNQREMYLTVFEFDRGTDATTSFLTNIYYATIDPDDVENTEGTGQSVKFSMTIKASVKPKVLHLMLADEKLWVDGGSIASVLPSLTVSRLYDDDPGDIQVLSRGGRSNNAPIRTSSATYWGSVELADGYQLDEEGRVSAAVRTKLTDIPMIRNIAKISVQIDPQVNNFELLGFELINVPTAGTVAPWDMNKLKVPELLNAENQMKSYDDLDYDGIVAGDAEFYNTEEEAVGWEFENTDDIFVYEHPYEQSRRSYLIVHGKFTRKLEGGGTEEKQGYYKLDIGQDDETDNNIFTHYNIIRNYHYKIRITQVETEGAATVSEAIQRAPFNNISFSTETANMLNISDGHNLLFVDATNRVIIDNDKPIEIFYRYVKDITGEQNDKDHYDEIHVKIGEGNVIPKGTVITPVPVKIGNENWMKISIPHNRPTSVMRTQTIIIVNEEGLGRTINLLLRTPWQYAPIVDENTGIRYYATIAPGEDDSYDGSDPAPKPIGSEAGLPLTVYFNLPSGLPSSIFPLDFQIESENQWIENNKIGTLVVTTGPSLFNPDNIAISYIKRVSYDEYRYQYNYNGNLDPNMPNDTHTIRCRFLTISEAVGESEIKIHNNYFSPDVSVKFERVRE